MDNLEYCLFICSVRADLSGQTKLAEDLAALATEYHNHESPGSDFDKSFDELSEKLHKYGDLAYSESARKKFRNTR
jgi:hypothetical protein